MCDTVVALPSVTTDGSVLFAKNSDRYPNEAQYIEIQPRKEYPPDVTLQCTYISIPQVEKTYQTFLSRPFWMWGAEMGVNEFGVAIGNEAVFSRVKPDKKPKLLGMDLVRLGLERSSTARDALEVITGLLEQYGQGGNCSYRHKFYYHNSYIIADHKEAWILETVDRLWAAKRVREFDSISNRLCIGSTWDEASDKLIERAQRLTNKKIKGDFNFSGFLTDVLYTRASCSKERRDRSRLLLYTHQGSIRVPTMAGILSDHGNSENSGGFLNKHLFNSTLCAHAGWGPARRDTQTTGSLIVHLKNNQCTIWTTGTSAPCTSLFKPVWFESDLPAIGPVPASTFEPKSFWWNHERLHRLAIESYPDYIQTFTEERDSVQEDLFSNALTTERSCRRAFTEKCFSEHAGCIDHWIEKIKAVRHPVKRTSLHHVAWKKFNKEAEIRI